MQVGERIAPLLKHIPIEIAGALSDEKGPHRAEHPLFLVVAAAQGAVMSQIGCNCGIQARQ
jgi:hypothetical protein